MASEAMAGSKNRLVVAPVADFPPGLPSYTRSHKFDGTDDVVDCGDRTELDWGSGDVAQEISISTTSGLI